MPVVTGTFRATGAHAVEALIFGSVYE